MLVEGLDDEGHIKIKLRRLIKKLMLKRHDSDLHARSSCVDIENLQPQPLTCNPGDLILHFVSVTVYPGANFRLTRQISWTIRWAVFGDTEMKVVKNEFPLHSVKLYFLLTNTWSRVDGCKKASKDDGLRATAAGKFFHRIMGRAYQMNQSEQKRENCIKLISFLRSPSWTWRSPFPSDFACRDMIAWGKEEKCDVINSRHRNLDTYKISNTTTWSIWNMDVYRRMLRISWTGHKTNDEVLNKIKIKRSLISTIRKRKLAYFGHIIRRHNLQRLCKKER